MNVISANALVLDEDVADVPRRPADHVQPSRRGAGLGLELGEEERRQRRLLGGFEHDRAARGERGGDLVRDEVEREVEGRDRGDDPDRHAERERDLAHPGGRRVHRHGVAGELARLDRRHGEGRDRAGSLDPCRLHGLARLSGDRPSRVVGALCEKSGDAVEDGGTLVRRQWVRHRSFCGVESASCLLGACAGHPSDHVARVRRADVDPVARLDPVSADEEALLDRGHGHGAQCRKLPSVSAIETQYARSGDVNIAYQVVGDGPIDLVWVMGWVSNVDYFWQEPSFARFLRRLASFSRLILFDKRGTGMSDRVPIDALPTLEQRMDDVRAVMDAVGSERAALVGLSEGGPMCLLFAATYPERTAATVIIGGYARRLWADDYPCGQPQADYDSFLEVIREEWGGPVGLRVRAPSVADDERFRTWWATYLRMSASPAAAHALRG